MKRQISIDATRGLVMLLMLVDHAREFFYLHAQVSDPVNVSTTPPDLFFTRLAAHLCAPVFVALTGLAAYLYQNKNGKSAASEFLLKRGIFLMVLELTVINFGWTFSFPPSTLFLQVIWAIGLSMICLSGILWLPRRALITLGLVIIFGHNLLDPISFSEGLGQQVWAIIHDRSYIDVLGMKVRTSYPVLPWIGVITLGYGIGPWFRSNAETKNKKLVNFGLTFLITFFLLRIINIYGEPLPWKLSDTYLQTVMSFFNLTKYPPSLDFLLLTLGTGLLILRGMEKESRLTRYLSVFGSTPLFFYMVHIYLLNIINSSLKFFLGPNQGNYFSVPNVWYLWLVSAVLAVPLWYICRWYGRIKKGSTNTLLKYI
ncbi:DUF1624 domain-containing protein [Peredibacter sp. HCB2-198]|uniref:DUF1624 domain-containing protein n=1 Tax=Peredibacter sp. HCB2-198 TaxID=3383025 RepID=UPI0038B6892A